LHPTITPNRATNGSLYHAFGTPAELPELIASIIKTTVPNPVQTAFQFHLTEAAVTHNTKVMNLHDFDLERAIIADGNSPLKYGSNFWLKSILAPLLDQHPNWKCIDELLTNRCSFIAPTLPENDRFQQLELAMSFGNHKGALKHPKQLLHLINKDVTH
jgi:hypothetical protein